MFEQQQADALALAETTLHHGIDPGAPGERYQVVVHVDAPVAGRSRCARPVRVVMKHARDGRVVEVAARTRTIPPAYAARSTTAIVVVASQAAACALFKCITSGTGPREAPPSSRISPCSVGATTAPSTRRAIRSLDSRMASFSSAGRTAESFPTFPLR